MTFLSTLPASIQRYIHFELYQSLPPPYDASPETLAARNDAALLALARLAPMNTAEALLAVQVIGSEAHARDALRGASLHHHDPDQLRRCRAQSALMTRQAAQARKELRLMQEARWEAERLRQMEAEAAARETEMAERRTDEAMVVPFMRKLAQRRRDAARKSRMMRQNPTTYSNETKSSEFSPLGSSGDPPPATQAGGTAPEALAV